jgi:pteridine reductase
MTRETTQRVAIVTGSGAQRVGNVVARRLAASGYRLVIHANRSLAGAQRTAEELSAAGAEAIALTADLRDEQAVERLVATVWERFGRIDVLVHCAAIWVSKPLEDTTAADVRDHFEVNALATFLLCQHVGLRMAAQPTGGVIVNLGDWAIARPYRHYAAYFASKGAIPTITRAFAVELAARNPRVRVNAILPGPVMLPQEMTTAQREAVVAQTLLKREGSPEHIAQAVEFLIANDFVTGICLPVDGGRTIYSDPLGEEYSLSDALAGDHARGSAFPTKEERRPSS